MDQISFHGLTNNLSLTNDVVELIVTLDIGPRVLSYRLLDGPNLFKVNEDELATAGESEWVMRGGHRLWIAPESDRTYFPDNHPVVMSELGDNHVLLESAPEVQNGVAKSLDIKLLSGSTEVEIKHRVTAIEDLNNPIAVWALTVLASGGTAIVPQPAFVPHPNDTQEKTLSANALLPNRQITLWPYTSLGDPRFDFSGEHLSITQTPGTKSFKIGFLFREGTVGYLLEDCLFTKTIEYLPDHDYPDNGSNLEIYTDASILELESLSPLFLLKKGESIVHKERWRLSRVDHQGATSNLPL